LGDSVPLTPLVASLRGIVSLPLYYLPLSISSVPQLLPIGPNPFFLRSDISPIKVILMGCLIPLGLLVQVRCWSAQFVGPVIAKLRYTRLYFIWRWNVSNLDSSSIFPQSLPGA